jgi:hypothetical protein
MTRERFAGTLKPPSESDKAEFEAWADAIAPLPCSVIAQDVPYLPRMGAKEVASEPVQKHVWVTVATTAVDGKLVRHRSQYVVSPKTQQRADAVMALLKDMKGGVDASRASKGKPRNRQAG